MTTPLLFAILASLLAYGPDIIPQPLATKTLLEVAARHGVPMPPKDARLILAHGETWINLTVPSTSREPAIYSPAFLLEKKADGSVVILRGTERRTLQNRHTWEPLWRPFSLEPVQPKVGGYAVGFESESCVVCAVQLAARGDEANAQAIWRCFAQGVWQRFAMWELQTQEKLADEIVSEFRDPMLILGRAVFDHLQYRLLEEPEHWPEIHARMKALFDEFPKLKDGTRRELFDDLATTVRAKPPATGSIEGLLLAWAKEPSRLRPFELFADREGSEANAPAREIVRRGYEAIPGLIALLDDRRITTHSLSGRVGDLANRLLHEITGTRAANSAAWLAWWNDTRRQREEDFITSAVFLCNGDQIYGVREGPAQIIGHKFPEKLALLCKQFSMDAVPIAQPFALARSVANSRLPKITRVNVLSDFARRGSPEHQRYVLQVLAKLDGKKCAEILRPLLARLPRDSDGPYGRCPESRWTHVVMQLDDDTIWRDYLRLAKECSVGLRLEMMDPMDYIYIRNTNRDRRLAFLAAFLGDDTVRDSSSAPRKFNGSYAASEFPKIAVRDVAAMQIALILDFVETPDEFWDSAQWSKLQEKVRAKLAKERLPSLE